MEWKGSMDKFFKFQTRFNAINEQQLGMAGGRKRGENSIVQFFQSREYGNRKWRTEQQRTVVKKFVKTVYYLPASRRVKALRTDEPPDLPTEQPINSYRVAHSLLKRRKRFIRGMSLRKIVNKTKEGIQERRMFVSTSLCWAADWRKPKTVVK